MLVLISPAKTMTASSKVDIPFVTKPQFFKESKEIALNMVRFSFEELARVLKVNPALAAENYIRFQNFHSDEDQSLLAILAYSGIVFKNINPGDFSLSDLEYTQDHLRIVSALYGLLKPFDLIKTYRMEFDIELPELAEGSMADYWREKLTSPFIKAIKSAGGILVNLASKEMKSAFDWKKVEKSVQIITPEFKIWRNGKPKTIVIYTKMARGQMARFIMQNRISKPEELKMFSWEGFTYSDELSNNNNWVFMQE